MKTVIITGAAGNLGRAVVQKFIKEGWRVVGTVSRAANATTERSSDLYEEFAIDVSKEEEARQLVQSVVERYGSIDAAVLTVGGFAKGTIVETGVQEVMKQYQLNFETAYNVAQPVFKEMIAGKRGRIFLIGSRPGLEAKSSKGLIAYGLAKSLLFRLAELMNEEGRTSNVVTSVVVPSTIDTPVNRQFSPGADFESWVTPDAIADVIYFYCTDEAAAIREPVIKLYNNA
jgi:NAD(P)-dependent dehydrogenase (short-subunit alcohol dehydrogenase family)